MRMLRLAAAGGFFITFALGAGAAFAQSIGPGALEYSPITPCRAFDTRATTPVAANTVRSFHISGSHDFPEQGGPAHGCGVPDYATAVSISLIAVNEADAGYLTAFAYRAPRPLTTSLYYQRGVTLVNTVITPISQGNLSIYSSKQTHVAGDVDGYYAPQIWAKVGETGSIMAASPRVISVVNYADGYYSVMVDRDVYSCSYDATTRYGLTSIGADQSDQSNVVRVMTSRNGVYGNAAFSIAVRCP